MTAYPDLDLPAPAAETDVLWFLPTHGDGRYLATEVGARHVTHRYLGQVARAADELGYFGVLLPTGQSCEDSWVVASSLVPLTERLRFLVAVRPGLQEPAVAARMTATLDRISNGRLLINVVTGGDPVEARGDGIFLPHDARYAVTDEFLTSTGACCARDGDASRASTCASRTAACCSRPCRSPTRRSTSAARPRPACGSPASTSTPT